MTWIVISGTILNTVCGGGLELFGPFDTEAAAKKYQRAMKQTKPDVCMAVELLRPSRRDKAA